MVPEPVPDLAVGEAIPRGWLEPGRSVAVDRAPTRFGPVSLAIHPVDEGRRMAARIELGTPPLAGAPAPRALKLHLRAPGKRPIAAATANGRPAAVSGEVITVEAPRGTVEIEARY